MNILLTAFLGLLNIAVLAQSSFPDNEKTVIVLIAPDCPISQKYIPTIKSIIEAYQGDISFEFYAPKQYNKKELRRFSKKYNLDFNVRIDKENKLSQELLADVTPEVFLFSEENLIYRGAINNWFVKLGENRLEPSEHYLMDAIEALLSGNKPDISETKAIGCKISY